MTQDAQVSVRHQCRLLGVNRSSLYYKAVEESGDDLVVMAEIDKLHLRYPFYGSRKIGHALRTTGKVINRKRVQRLMREMGVESIAPKPNTSRPSPDNPVFPYLLRNMRIEEINKVWAADITYIPMAHGFAFYGVECPGHTYPSTESRDIRRTVFGSSGASGMRTRWVVQRSDRQLSHPFAARSVQCVGTASSFGRDSMSVFFARARTILL